MVFGLVPVKSRESVFARNLILSAINLKPYIGWALVKKKPKLKPIDGIKLKVVVVKQLLVELEVVMEHIFVKKKFPVIFVSKHRVRV
jgi:hypothetical protein